MASTQAASLYKDAVRDTVIVQRGWEAVGRGDWDTLLADYTADMIFVMPGQNDLLEGKLAFREALDNLGATLPAGFEITAIRRIGDSGEVVSILDWKSDKVPAGSQLAVLLKLRGSKVFEERWFIDTEQWEAAF